MTVNYMQWSAITGSRYEGTGSGVSHVQPYWFLWQHTPVRGQGLQAPSEFEWESGCVRVLAPLNMHL